MVAFFMFSLLSLVASFFLADSLRCAAWHQHAATLNPFENKPFLSPGFDGKCVDPNSVLLVVAECGDMRSALVADIIENHFPLDARCGQRRYARGPKRGRFVPQDKIASEVEAFMLLAPGVVKVDEERGGECRTEDEILDQYGYHQDDLAYYGMRYFEANGLKEKMHFLLLVAHLDHLESLAQPWAQDWADHRVWLDSVVALHQWGEARQKQAQQTITA